MKVTNSSSLLFEFIKTSITCPFQCLEPPYTTLMICRMLSRLIPNSPWMTHGVQVIGVPSLEAYLLCLKCKGKVQLHDDDEELGTCTKCNMTQLIASCATQLTAKLFVQCGPTYYTFQAFSEMLSQITDNEEVTIKNLIKAPQFTMCHNSNFVIVSVTRS